MGIIFRENIPLGLDISDLKIRLIQLGKKGRSIKISAFSEMDVPSGIMRDGLILQPDKMLEIVKEAKKKITGFRYPQNKVIVCLPEKQSFIKMTPIENIESENIEKEISKHIPFNINEVYYSYEIMKSFYDNELALHFAACKRIIIDSYIKILETAGFEPEVLELETESTARCLLLPNDKLTYLIVDVGTARTTLSIVQKSLVVFSISYETVIKAKEKEAYLTELLSNIKKVVNFYDQELTDESKISNIVTCGSGAYIKNLNEETQKQFGLRSVPGNPWQNIKNYNSALVKKIEYPLAYTTSIGLALRAALNKDYI